MKTAFITDQHFGVRSDSLVFLDNYERFYKETFFPTIDKLGITTVVDLGDLMENRRVTNSQTMKRTKAMWFDELRNRGIKLIKIYGNHDVFFRNRNDVNSVDIFGEIYENVHIIQAHEVVDLGVPVGLISWINNSNLEESLEWIAGLPGKGVKHLGGHFEIKGFEMTKGQAATHGFDKEVFDGFDAVWSGHFHVRSQQGQIKYLSNPSQTNWGDVGLEKGFHVFDSETGEMTPYNNPFEMYKEITWGVDEARVEDFQGKYGRIHVPAFQGKSRAEIDVFIDAANERCLGIQVIEGTVKLDGVDVDDEDDTMSTAMIVDAYIDDAVGSREDLDPEVLKKMFRELLADATSRMEIE
ncbi:recombination-related endonuclease [Acidovorax phage ACP17]|uniref:Recombination-related endonuclease n=1 Tax=Acidovorax phage ACP17 TaxID=2010329 RepID=A0A218M2W6_9CAUD|nr:recombination-related endonuclease [Acidovorax phage ACP17]ASD50386.1 recombination-related endonuclease [Acidovorax phage ACP17]